MNKFEAIVSIAQTLLRVKNQWHGGATAFEDIDRAVAQACQLIPGDSDEASNAARTELRRRAA